jgi:hypothetical protein
VVKSAAEVEVPMVKAKECAISVELALALRNLDRGLARHFRCTECGEPVEPHEAGVGSDGVEHPAHFEHVKGNPECSRGHHYEMTQA